MEQLPEKPEIARLEDPHIEREESRRDGKGNQKLQSICRRLFAQAAIAPSAADTHREIR